MTGTNTKLAAAVESYFADLGRVRASGGATDERSSYGPLANLLNAVGATLRPKVFCVGELADQGAGHPDFGLYSAKQVQRGRPREGQTPERGVVEVKPPHEDMLGPAVREQVGRYWSRYRLVLTTNLREFALVCEDAAGEEAALETFRLAGSDAAFERKLQTPRAFAREVGTGLIEYLCRACPTGPRSPSRRTWRGCSRPTPATVSHGSRRLVTHPRSPQCAPRFYGVFPAPHDSSSEKARATSMLG